MNIWIRVIIYIISYIIGWIMGYYLVPKFYDFIRNKDKKE